MTSVSTLWITLSCLIVNDNLNITNGSNQLSIGAFYTISNSSTYAPTVLFPSPPVPALNEDTTPLSGKDFLFLIVAVLIGLPVLFVSVVASVVCMFRRHGAQYIELKEFA